MTQLPQTQPPKGTDLQATLRSVGALMLREMSTRYGRTPGGYVWSLLEPLGMIIILAFAFSLLSRSPQLGTSFLLFKATGYLVLQMFNVLGHQVGHALVFSKPLLQYPRVTWGDAILARFLLNFLMVTCITILIILGIIIFEQLNVVVDWPLVVIAMVLTGLLGFGVGTLNCFLFIRYPVWQNLWGILTRPLFIISGVVLLYEDMPTLAQTVLWYNPILHLTGIMREGFYPLYRPDYISFQFVWLTILFPLVIGLLLLRRHHRELLNR
jgi:capsular polysaccharide transport system permease protein